MDEDEYNEKMERQYHSQFEQNSGPRGNNNNDIRNIKQNNGMMNKQ